MDGKRCDSEAGGDDVIEGNDEKKIKNKNGKCQSHHSISQGKARTAETLRVFLPVSLVTQHGVQGPIYGIHHRSWTRPEQRHQRTTRMSVGLDCLQQALHHADAVTLLLAPLLDPFADLGLIGMAEQ